MPRDPTSGIWQVGADRRTIRLRPDVAVCTIIGPGQPVGIVCLGRSLHTTYAGNLSYPPNYANTTPEWRGECYMAWMPVARFLLATIVLAACMLHVSENVASAGSQSSPNGGAPVLLPVASIVDAPAHHFGFTQGRVLAQ